MRLRTRITGYYSSSIIATLAVQHNYYYSNKMGDSLNVFKKELEPELEFELEEEPSIPDKGKEGIIIVTS